ncbi:endolytic transglycosylase MltG [Flavilitoribacter nigricans]|uniref:Endolytic murein transglycosylase n=1 Tax=Flavilitoribacter nigricans (strain ATCC 23147 / DSM 23189 / NBRC 102662 / NCIMB 1420 / SS-2) TaxID=1122177 RepID=A0A2D0N2P5_FLAN2|nr:endolytic transglycosylase MltG [Flavilitoribacter nigricans]PHN02680.1 aminodeoxychorismate lyase [Flavilitoribacter nigricans DSM 23189 = NBRC 102662]
MKKTILIALIAVAVTALGIALYYYNQLAIKAAVPRDLQDPIVLIPSNSSYEEVVAILRERNMLGNEQLFHQMTKRMGYRRDPMRNGRFAVEPGWSMIELIRHLRNGKQDPVDVVLTNERLLENVAAKVARFIEPDSLSVITTFKDPEILQQMGFTEETLMSLFIPNTYELFWNTTPGEFLERMQKEHDRFWNNGRLEKAKALDMSPAEVYTLASIVEKETLQDSEKKRMAGVYLNRLRTNMRLQADPTSVFARRDFNTRRVTDYHTKFDSPYNTYVYKGLPPGPIAMASISSIDAVLGAEDHDYVYFCARGDGSGFHNFAKTLAAHNQNAALYRENQRKRGLR